VKTQNNKVRVLKTVSSQVQFK